MKFPKAWSNGQQPKALTAFKIDATGLVPQPTARLVSKVESGPTKILARGTEVIEQPGTMIEADGDIARWWQEMSDASKAEYVAEHPTSKYADMHREAKSSGGTDIKVPEKEAPAPEPKAEAPAKPVEKPVKPYHKPAGHGPGHKNHAPAPQPKKPVPSEKPPADSSHENVGTPDKASLHKMLSEPENKPGSPERKGAIGFLRKKSSHIISHLKHDAKEWKHAGHAMKKLATGKPLEHADKKAMGAVAADIATVTASLLLTGGAAHGIIAFMTHFGTHLAQEAMLKAAVKGAAGAAAHASMRMVTSASDEDEMMKRTIAYMMDQLENGDLEEMMKRFEAQAQKEGEGAEAKKEVREASTLTAAVGTEVGAKLDMSAEVAGQGKCPDCKGPTVIACIDGEVPSFACRACRISLPIPSNHDYYNKQQGVGQEEGQDQVR